MQSYDILPSPHLLGPDLVKPKSTNNADHYTLGGGCDGRILAPFPDMIVIEEQMPAGTEERRHHMKERGISVRKSRWSGAPK